MKNLIKYSAFSITALLCSANVSATEIYKQNYIDAIKQTDLFSNLSTDRFANALAHEYKSLAIHRYNIANDKISANHFAKKSFFAHNGERVTPDNVYKINLPANSIVEASNYYEDLRHLLTSELTNKYPELMAEAQVKFDCYTNSEAKNLGHAQSSNCLNRFLKARKYLFEKLEEIKGCCCKNKEQKKETKKTQQRKPFDGQYIAIPKWPNLPILKNNPPIPNNNQEKDYSKDITELKLSLVQIKNLINKINKAQPASTTDTPTLAGTDNATKEDIEKLKNAIDNLSNEIGKLKNQNPNFNDLDSLQDELNKLNDKIDSLDTKCDEKQEPIFNEINEDDEIETEVFDKPSELLPYEIYFDWDKSDIDYKFIPQIKDIAEKALSSKETIIIQGHTDSSGTPEHNKELSYKRAENVGKIIMSYGIPKENITLQGVGSTDPKIKTKDGVQQPENRRVVIK